MTITDRRDCTCTDADRAAGDVDPDCGRHGVTTRELRDATRAHHAGRCRALSWLHGQAPLLRDAYALTVGIDGQVTIQGQTGTLAHLVDRWAATPSTESVYPTWVARVPYGGHTITVRIVEA